MQQVQCGRWLLACDPQATRAAYASMVSEWEDDCNFVQARDQGLVFPIAVMELFEQLGIDYRRDTEHYHLARLDSGLHEYGGWFHFVGRILSGRDAQRPVAPNAWHFDPDQITANFALGFTAQVSLLEPSFEGHPVVQLEFDARVPWILGEPEPD